LALASSEKSARERLLAALPLSDTQTDTAATWRGAPKGTVKEEATSVPNEGAEATGKE
jgi:hypothetical protein